MARYNNIARLVEALCLLSLPTSQAANTTVVVNFGGSINIGTCNIALDSHLIDFGVHHTRDFAVNDTAAIMPLTAQVDCTATAPASRITVTGNLPFSGTPVFRDNGASSAAGVGFLVRQDYPGSSLTNFYINSIALSPTKPVTLPAIPVGTTYNQKFLIGLVRPFGVPSTGVTGGTVEVTLTFNVDFS